MKGFCFALALLTVVLVTDVQSQEDDTSCDRVSCVEGSTCRFVIKKRVIRQQCIETSRIPKNGSPRRCGSSGQPLLVMRKNGVKVWKGKFCPEDLVRVKRYCCADTEKEGLCPDPCGFVGCPPLLAECEDKCTGDNRCKGDKKCCRSECQGTECVDPFFPIVACSFLGCPQDVACEILECGAGETCVESNSGASCERPVVTCATLSCQEGFVCQELLPTGAECLEACTSDQDCDQPNSRCRLDKCTCKQGYYYSVSTKACLDSCSLADLQGTYLPYPDAVTWDGIGTRFFNTSLDECRQGCTDKGDCINFEAFERDGSCYHVAVNPRDKPASAWIDDRPGWTYYQKNCL